MPRLAWLAPGAVLGALLPVLGVVVIVAFNAFYWLPIRGESPCPRTEKRSASRVAVEIRRGAGWAWASA